MDSFQPGDFFGRYCIKQKLGSGGMSDVYLAIDENKLLVAVKILHKNQLQNKENGIRFQKEISAVKSLNHTGVVSIIDVGEIDGLQYYSMEYLEGGSLRKKIEAGISLKDTIEIVIKLSTSLQYIHKQGYVHRDIKPENILFDSCGEPVITDLGVVKLLTMDSRLTQTGIGIGTPYYMSPEQARGGDIDGRSDIYSLGIVLYEMLIGEVPYDGDSAVSIIMAHVESAIPKLPKYISSFQPVITKMIAKCPDERYRDCEELIDNLSLLLATENHAQNIDRRNNTTCIDIKINKRSRLGFVAIFLIIAVSSLLAFYFAELGENEQTISVNEIPSKVPDKEIEKGVVLPINQQSIRGSEHNSEPKEETQNPTFEKKKDKSGVGANTAPKDIIAAKAGEISQSDKSDGPPIFRIESQPSGAEIVINGRPFGRTPYYGREIASGTHILTLRLAGYESFSSNVELKQGELTEKKVELVKAKGELFIKSNPSGAMIVIDGINTKMVTPYRFKKIDAGTHKIELRLPKYYTLKTSVKVLGGKKVGLEKDLEGGDLVLDEGVWVSKEQKIANLLKKAEMLVENEQLVGKDIDSAFGIYSKVLKADPDNYKAKQGIKTVADKLLKIASYYCEEEIFSQCFEYIMHLQKVDNDNADAKVLLSDSITRLAWEKVLSGNSIGYKEAVEEVITQYQIKSDDIAEPKINYETKIADVEKYIEIGDWSKAFDGIVWLEAQSGMETIAKKLRIKYQALKDYYRNGRIIRDRLKDGTLGPRLIVIPVISSDSENAGNQRLYLIGETEVSNRQYIKFIKGSGIEDNSRLDYPVVDITAEQAKAYTNWLTLQTGKKYRLPTANELEFAYGGKNKPNSKKVCSPLLNFEDTSTGSKNEFGLIGHVRNVWEITSTCSDNTCENYVLKGGALEEDPGIESGFNMISYCISKPSDKNLIEAGDKNIATGFRVLREMQ